MKIVFVCTGNASRSAASEVVLRKMLAQNNMQAIEVESCGTDVPQGLCREEVMCRIAAEAGYSLGGKAVKMSAQILESADLIIVMTEDHRSQVLQFLNSNMQDKRIVRFNDFCFGDDSDLPDPHYHGESVYRKCFDTIERGCREIIKKLKE